MAEARVLETLMGQSSSKTIMCSVFFLDIVEYSKKSVNGQISLKERFNNFLSLAIRDVPIVDRIILDTGDGAALNFLGDIEDALKAALSMRESLLNEDANIDYPLLVRMGINIGPVRLVRDINGQPNIVGDGINVAQRVMGFADASQILVSRSYYDAVSRVSPHYAGMFHYQGSRTDKHVREHEVYAIGYPGDKTTIGRTARLFFERSEGPLGRGFAFVTLMWRIGVVRFGRAGFKQRARYVVIGATLAFLLIIPLVYLMSHNENPTTSASTSKPELLTFLPDSTVAAVPPPPTLIVEPESAIPATVESEKVGAKLSNAEIEKVDEKLSNIKLKKREVKSSKKVLIQDIKVVEEKQVGKADATNVEFNPKLISSSAVVRPMEESRDALMYQLEGLLSTDEEGAFLSVLCIDGAEVFLDGIRKGRVSGSTLTIEGTPGLHTVIVSHPLGVDSRDVAFELGSTLLIKPSFCN